MTSAALQVEALRHCLAETNSHDLSGRYFRAAAKKLTPMWQANRLNDFAVIPAHDWHSIPQRLLNWRTDNLMAAAADDIALTEAFMRMVQLLDPPTQLLRPSHLIRVITGSRRRTNVPTSRTGSTTPVRRGSPPTVGTTS